MFRQIVFSFGAGILLSCAACATYHYDGESLAPLPSDAKVSFFLQKDSPPPGYRTLGVFSFTARAGMGSGSIRSILTEQARARGADGVLILKMKKIPAGEARTDQIRNQSAPGWNIEDNSMTANSYVTDTILYSSGKDPDKTLYKTEVEADFLQKLDSAKPAAR